MAAGYYDFSGMPVKTEQRKGGLGARAKAAER
jgi:hypothetical protein